MSDPCTFTIADLQAEVARAFEASNVSPANARLVAKALVRAEVDGRKGHGLSRVASYTAQARSGKVDGHATPKCLGRKPSALMIDAAHGFAYPALQLAHKHLPEIARATGIAAAGLTRSHHFGVAGHVVEDLADAGLVALAFGNTPKAIAPWGGKSGVFGTNPIAFAAPLADRPPVVVDLALSEVARGNILKAQQTGEPIPQGWALDRDGRPTTDPSAALEGTMAPFGGAKGAALAFMVEVLGAALVGASLASEAASFFTPDGPPPGVGQLLIAIDPEAFAGSALFAERMATLAGDIERQEGARLPGSRRIALRETAQKQGVPVDPKQLSEIRAIAAG